MADAITRALRARFWKSHLLLPETPRKGDKAAVVCDHHRTETGLLVKVLDDPVFAKCPCTECGVEIEGWFVEVQLLDELGREPPEGFHIYAYPIKWLQRVLPLGHPDASHRLVALP